MGIHWINKQIARKVILFQFLFLFIGYWTSTSASQTLRKKLDNFPLELQDSLTLTRSSDNETRVLPIALETNLLYDAALVPSIGLECAVTSRTSIHLQWEYGWHKCDHVHRYWRFYGGDLAYRYWLSKKKSAEQPFTGHHLGVYAQMVTYDVEWTGRGYLGDRWSFGEGFEYGYSHPLRQGLLLDFVIGIGHLAGKYKVYDPVDNCYVWKATRRLQWFGPTKAEISLKWLFEYSFQTKRFKVKGGKQ